MGVVVVYRYLWMLGRDDVVTACLPPLGIKESDTGLAPPALWDLAADKQTLQSEQPLQVAR